MLSVTTHRDKEIVNHRADMVPNQGSCITESGRSLDQSELVCAIGEDKTASSSLGFVTSNFDSLELTPLSSGRLECSVVERGLIWRSRMAAGRALGAEALYVCTVLLLDYSASCSRFAEYLFYCSVSTRKCRFNCSMLMCCLVRSQFSDLIELSVILRVVCSRECRPLTVYSAMWIASGLRRQYEVRKWISRCFCISTHSG